MIEIQLKVKVLIYTDRFCNVPPLSTVFTSQSNSKGLDTPDVALAMIVTRNQGCIQWVLAFWAETEETSGTNHPVDGGRVVG